MAILYTSDLHFYHKKTIWYDKRPFYNIGEMHDTLIRNWNRKVTNEDTVYILGDTAMGKNVGIADVLNELNGTKILIKGNHDTLTEEIENCYSEIHDYLKIKDGENIVVLSHYPIMFYENQHKNAYHLYGHVHNSDEETLLYKFKQMVKDANIPCNMYNVGCMHWDYEPVTLQEILEKEK